MLLSNAIVAILALSAIATPSSGLVLSNTGLFHRSGIFKRYTTLAPDEILNSLKATSVEKRQEIEQDEAHICAVHVCPPRFGGILVNGVCECKQLVDLKTSTNLSSTTKSADTPTVKHQEIADDEATICAVRVCPPRFGAILVDGVCTCTHYGLPPPTPVRRSETNYDDCETYCEPGYTGKLFGEYCRCVFAGKFYPFSVIKKRQEVDNCLARTCLPRYFSAPDGKGGCDCVHGTQFAPPAA